MLEEVVDQPILDVSCPHCGKKLDAYQHSIDETEFSSDGTGHYFDIYYVDYGCEKCSKTFRVYFKFKYEITEARY